MPDDNTVIVEAVEIENDGTGDAIAPAAVQIVTVEEPGANLPAPVTPTAISETEAVLGLLERIVLNPEADIEKMEKVVGLFERMNANKAKAAFYADFAAMQADIPIVTENGELVHPSKKEGEAPKLISTYAFFEDINEAVCPVLAKHGFGVSFLPKREGDRVIVTAVLSHKFGHFTEAVVDLPLDGSGAKNNVQSYGSSVSYGKRYALCAILNIATRPPKGPGLKSEDDDGVLAGAPATITEDEAANLRELAEAAGVNTKRFFEYFKIGSFEELPATRHDEAKQRIEQRRRANQS